MAVKELETVLADEPGLLGPKARDRNVGQGMVADDKSLSGRGHDLAFRSFCISEAFVICLSMHRLILLNLLEVSQTSWISFWGTIRG